MKATPDFFAVCDDETGAEIGHYKNQMDALTAANTALIASGRDFFCDPRWGQMPQKFTSRRADDEAQERAIETARISLLEKSAKTEDQFHFLLAFARDLARDFMAAGSPIPRAVADAASSARNALNLGQPYRKPRVSIQVVDLASAKLRAASDQINVLCK